jgi:four helix bundle protein
MTAQNFTELIVWQRAMDLVQEAYSLALPREELYGLTAQLRRAAISIPANIAEGQGRRSSSEFRHHLSIAHGSLLELETQIRIVGRLNYVDDGRVEALLQLTAEVGRLLNGLYRSLPFRRKI